VIKKNEIFFLFLRNTLAGRLMTIIIGLTPFVQKKSQLQYFDVISPTETIYFASHYLIFCVLHTSKQYFVFR